MDNTKLMVSSRHSTTDATRTIFLFISKIEGMKLDRQGDEVDMGGNGKGKPW